MKFERWSCKGRKHWSIDTQWFTIYYVGKLEVWYKI